MAAYRVLFLDLDDTLYPIENGIWDAIAGRIQSFMVERIGLTHDQASQLRQCYFQRYGTTLNGLHTDYNVDPREYMHFVHDIPLSDYLSPNPALRAMLLQLPQRKVIFTNADLTHVQRVTELLNVADCIDDVIDLFRVDLINKPEPEAYRMALRICGEVEGPACVMVDDQLRNLYPARDLGMVTVLAHRTDPSAMADHCIERITDLIEAVPNILSPFPPGGSYAAT